MAIASELPCKRLVTAGYRGERGNATIEEMWKEVFSVWSVQQRNTSVAFSTNSNMASLLWGHGVGTGI
jgi:hypothetical protein